MGLLWTADALARHTFHHMFLIEPIILRGGIVLLHGKRGIGKSHFALTLAACLSEEGALFGRYPASCFGPVVYVQADVPPWLTQSRVRRMQRVYALKDIHFFFPTFLNIVTLMPQHEIVKEIQDLNPSLVIWDTLRKIHREDSNNDYVPSLIYGKARSLFPAATHMFVHHDRKTNLEQVREEDEEEFRGSGAWIDDAHTAMHLVEIAPYRLALYFTKTNACEDQPPLHLGLDRDLLALYSTPEQTKRLAGWWTEKHPTGQPTDLERYLLGSFVGGPKIIRQVVEQAFSPVLARSP